MSVLSLLCLLVAVHLGESTTDGLDYTSKLTGEGRSLMLGHNQWLPCSDKMPATWKMEQTPILALLCRRKKLSPSNQLWSEDSPVPSRVSSAPDGAFLVEREKDLSTYNWNSFGLRYGKRQSGAVNSKIKFF